MKNYRELDRSNSFSPLPDIKKDSLIVLVLKIDRKQGGCEELKSEVVIGGTGMVGLLGFGEHP